MTGLDGTFGLNVAPGSYVVLFQLAGFQTRVLQHVFSGRPLANVLLSLTGFPCDEGGKNSQNVRVIDAGDQVVPLSRVSGGCEVCWMSNEGLCTVRIPTRPDLPGMISVSHVDFEPAVISPSIPSAADVTVRLAKRQTTSLAPSAVPTVRVVTSWQAWTMEVTGPERLLTRFLNDVDGHRFDGWNVQVTDDGTFVRFRFPSDDWTLGIETQDIRLTFGGAEGNLGVLRGHVLGKALESRFDHVPGLAVLAVFRIL